MVFSKIVHQALCVVMFITLTLSGANAGFSEPFGNGDFSSPLNVGWTRYGEGSDVVSIIGGVGVLSESWDAGWAFLEQEFTLPVDVTCLSFEYQPLFESGGEESFSVSLLDPSDNPLLSHNTGGSFFFMHDWSELSGVDELFFDPAYVDILDIGNEWYRITLDLMDLNGIETDAMLAFDFIPGFGDLEVLGQIKIDNIFIQTGLPNLIPVPGAIFLVLVGLGSIRIAKRNSVVR